jgi:hypothetical protein
MPTDGPSGVVAAPPNHPGTLQDDHPGGGKSDQQSIIGLRARFRFHEFFIARIRNPNTRRAYGLAVADFPAWCELQLAALRHLFDWW